LFDIQKEFNQIEDLENLKLFFKTLEKWLEFKLSKNIGNIGVDLKKNEIKNNIILDFNEFFQMYKDNKKLIKTFK
jgi:hypothetical protein